MRYGIAFLMRCSLIDGTFQIAPIPEGMLTLKELLFGDGWFISDVILDERDV